MTLDIRGGLKNTKVNSNPLVVFDELISNSIDAYLMRRSTDVSVQGFELSILTNIVPIDLLDNEFTFTVSCKDNGVGFTDPVVKAFVTKDTSLKDDLAIPGINTCKGSGRIQYFHHFNRVAIESVYRKQDEIFRRTILVDATRDKEIHEGSFIEDVADGAEISTTVSLDLMKNDAWERFFRAQDVAHLVSAHALRRYVLVTFLRRFVSLKDMLGNFKIQFHSKYNDIAEDATLEGADLPIVDQVYPINAHFDNGTVAGGVAELSIAHYKLDQQQFDLGRNTVALCAKATLVSRSHPVICA